MPQELFCYFRMVVLGGAYVLVMGEFGGLLKTLLTISLKDIYIFHKQYIQSSFSFSTS